MTLGTKVLFVHPCFGMGPVSLLLLLGLTRCHLSARIALSPPRLCPSRGAQTCVTVKVCTGHDLGFLMWTGISQAPTFHFPQLCFCENLEVKTTFRSYRLMIMAASQGTSWTQQSRSLSVIQILGRHQIRSNSSSVHTLLHLFDHFILGACVSVVQL